MIPKKLAPAKAGVADFSDKIMRKIKENRERCRFNLIEKRSKAAHAVAGWRCLPGSAVGVKNMNILAITMVTARK